MCGIAGVAAFHGVVNGEVRVAEDMIATLRHRGPDEERVVVRGSVAIGASRLSIIDLEGGSQPVQNEDGTVTVAFNGEIYNYRALSEDLKARGHKFRSRGDTEVLVHAYEEFGVDFLGRLKGMFAISLHDARRGRLILARDPIGIKPLYFSVNQRYVVWGSEVKSVLASGLVEKELDLDALGEFLAWEYVPSPATLIRAIRKLPPGQYLDVDLLEGSAKPRRYWDLQPTETTLADAQWEEAVNEQISRSVRSQMESEVPLGAFLSGGVDSSLVVSAMNGAQAFSIGFEERTYNELEYAGRVARHLGVHHVQQTIRPDVEELFLELIPHLDDPIGDFSIFPTYLVSRLAKEQVTVVLSGDGGDELFGGYETYAADRVANSYEKLPAVLREDVFEPVAARMKPRPSKKGLVNKGKRFLEGMSHGKELGHARWRLFAGDGVVDALLEPDIAAQRTCGVGRHIVDLYREASGFTPLTRALYVDLKSYLSDNILTKVDRMSMAVSLEARVPYLDTDLVRLAFSMPDRLKVRYGRTKILLKRIAARRVPRSCVYRSKQGFSIPMKTWLNGCFVPLVDEFLDVNVLRRQGILDAESVARLVREHRQGTVNHSHLLWSLIVFQAWHKHWYRA